MTPGIYPASAIPMSKYIADDLCEVPTLSSGCAHTLVTRSPAHAFAAHPRLGGLPEDEPSEDEPSEDEAREKAATLVGKLAHELLLGGDGKICVIEPSEYRSEPKRKGEEGGIPKGWTNSAIRAARSQAICNGLIPVLPKQMAAARRMVLAARQFIERDAGVGDDAGIRERLRAVFATGVSESTLLWQEGDVLLRARPDWMNSDRRVMLHFKTTMASASPEPFMRGIMESMGYDTALAFYRRGFEALTQQTDWLHVILVQEQKPPHACSIISLDTVKWAVADDKVSAAITLWAACMKARHWPAYPGCVHYAAPRPWEIAELEISYD